MNEALYSDDEEDDVDDLAIQSSDNENDESIPFEEPQNDKSNIVKVGIAALEKWAQVEGHSNTEIEGI